MWPQAGGTILQVKAKGVQIVLGVGGHGSSSQVSTEIEGRAQCGGHHAMAHTQDCSSLRNTMCPCTPYVALPTPWHCAVRNCKVKSKLPGLSCSHIAQEANSTVHCM